MIGRFALLIGARDFPGRVHVVLRRFQIISGDLLRAGRFGLVDRRLRDIDMLLRRRSATVVDRRRLVLHDEIAAAAELRDVGLQLTDGEIRAEPLRFGQRCTRRPQRFFRAKAGLIAHLRSRGVPVLLREPNAPLRFVVQRSREIDRAGILGGSQHLLRLHQHVPTLGERRDGDKRSEKTAHEMSVHTSSFGTTLPDFLQNGC